jgi:DMSO/TMAO reductase YedYZ molybdopterin-dependent catalytic subunit
MAGALHPQTILATRYAREPISDPFGFPLRLRIAAKLGFKNGKWVTAIEATTTLRGASRATGRSSLHDATRRRAAEG